MPYSSITVRLDDQVKKNAEILFEGLGLNMSSAVNAFIYAALRHGGLPFSLIDPFYSESNQKRLRESIAQAERGEFIVKTMEELKAMEDE